MARKIIFGAFVVGQAAVLLLAGVATLWWSSDLMTWLIWLVGEEYALGPQNVVHLENGAKLITNPAGMIRWTLPFWFLGTIQIVAAFTLIWLWSRRRPGRWPMDRSEAQSEPTSGRHDERGSRAGAGH